jgi:hypothetical protein
MALVRHSNRLSEAGALALEATQAQEEFDKHQQEQAVRQQQQAGIKDAGDIALVHCHTHTSTSHCVAS